MFLSKEALALLLCKKFKEGNYMCKVIGDFKISLIEDGKSPKTIESYVGDIEAFKEFLGWIFEDLCVVGKKVLAASFLHCT